MNSRKLFSHARPALCLAVALAFVPAAVVPQENEPKVLKKVLPAYPDILKKMGVSGTVRVKVTIGSDGDSHSTRIEVLWLRAHGRMAPMRCVANTTFEYRTSLLVG